MALLPLFPTIFLCAIFLLLLPPSCNAGILTTLTNKLAENLPGKLSSSTSASAAIPAFLDWFTSQGGYINPSVTLSPFPGYGNGIRALTDVSQLEVIYEVPPSLIFTREKVIEHYSPLIDEEFTRPLQRSPVSDDHVIALQLIVECSLGDKSIFKPYMDVLPKEVNTLEIFDDQELLQLQHPHLTQINRNLKETTEKAYEYLLPSLNAMLSSLSKDGSSSTVPAGAKSCRTLESFRHFTSVVGSRAMVFKGVKSLAPLADMMNYGPRDDGREGNNGLSFLDYHQLTEDGGIVVKADRDVHPSDSNSNDGQLFEDYGDNANGLYLEAHGFVPYHNPFDCAIVSLPPSKGELSEIAEGLGIFVRGREETLEVCLKDQKGGGLRSNTREFAYAAVLGLEKEEDHGGVRDAKELREACLDSVRKGDSTTGEGRLDMANKCLRYPGFDWATIEVFERAAASRLNEFPTSIDEDAKTLKEAGWEGRMDMALRYRMNVKKILNTVIGKAVQEEEVISEKAVVEDSLQSQVDSFNTFVSQLSLPVNSLEAYVAGSGLRVGTRATRNIQKGSVYISIPDDRTMSSATASAEDPKVQNVIEIGKQRNDDFHTLLFFLLHERFNLEKDSFWWPYLRLLPTLEDYRSNNPVFFSGDMLRFFSGSGVRSMVEDNASKVHRQFEAISNDKTVTSALGGAWTLDNYMWASTILDSRSIWWDGVRHLVPLLDLINCKELTDPKAVHKTEREGDNAVTRAPDNFEEGEVSYKQKIESIITVPLHLQIRLTLWLTIPPPPPPVKRLLLFLLLFLPTPPRSKCTKIMGSPITSIFSITASFWRRTRTTAAALLPRSTPPPTKRTLPSCRKSYGKTSSTATHKHSAWGTSKRKNQSKNSRKWADFSGSERGKTTTTTLRMVSSRMGQK